MKKTKKNIAIKNAVNYVDNIMRLQCCHIGASLTFTY